ncbi:eCIS core domain-containing protein [Cryptosporangium minutisporangium]|uniref:eCIS core domain-containing protein n=1 Tax=Cryptosporangium minutisporangium TaxID=113569 RepID=A0ABP6T0N6_9ACTN
MPATDPPAPEPSDHVREPATTTGPRAAAATNFQGRTVTVPPSAGSRYAPEPDAVRGQLGAGETLPTHLRAAAEATTDRELGEVRVHRDTAVAADVGARALTVGADIAIAPGEPQPGTAAGDRLLRHEIGHVLQQLDGPPHAAPGLPGPAAETEADEISDAMAAGRRPLTVTPLGGHAVQHQDVPDAGPSSEAFEPVSTFVLDPALEAAPPANVTTHVRVVGPAATGVDRYVQLDRPVRTAERITVYAVPLADVYDNPDEAAMATASDPFRIPPDLPEGAPAWTLNGSFIVSAVTDEYAFTTQPTPDAVGAGVVVVVDTSSGRILLDAGQQLSTPALAAPVGAEIARRLGETAPVRRFDEAVLMKGAPNGHNLPFVAERFAIGQIRATVDQYADPRARETLDAVRGAEAEYRRWLESDLRARLDTERAAWEARQPIAANAAIREVRWNHYVESQVSALLGTVVPPALMLAEETGGLVTLTGAPVDPAAGPTAIDAAIVDRLDTEWEKVPDEVVIGIGGGGMYLLDSYGVMLKPRQAPVPDVTVPNLRPTGPTGPQPIGAKTPTSWMGIPALGKAALIVVRTNVGMGFIMDAGTEVERFLPVEAARRMAIELGVSTLDAILTSHAHDDHVNVIRRLMAEHNIPPDRVIVSRSWTGLKTKVYTDLITDLRTRAGAEPVRTRLGPTWEPGLDLTGPKDSVTTTGVQLGGGRSVEIFALGGAQSDYQAKIAAGKSPGKLVDTGSFLYLFGNETSGNRAIVLGDLRGADFSAFLKDTAPGAARLDAALTGVKVLVGFGHHFGLAAGKSGSEDVKGMELLLRRLLLRNGELTIVIQSDAEFSFGKTPTAPNAQALLEFVTRLGARVVFAGEPTSPTPGGEAVLSSDLTVRTSGTGITQYSGEARTVAVLERLQMLHEAKRTVLSDAEMGPRHLRSTLPAADLVAGLNAEIAYLESRLNELVTLRGNELIEARGTEISAGKKAEFLADPERASVRAGVTADQIHTELQRVGAIEAALPGDVVTHLRAAIRLGSTLTIEAELSAIPRGVTEAIARLPEPRRVALERIYQQLKDAGATIDGDRVPADKRLDLMTRTTALRTELAAAANELTGPERTVLDGELHRVDAVLERLSEGVLRRESITRNAAGEQVKTEFLMKAPDKIDRVFGRIGQGFGALMVIHSVGGLASTAGGVASGEATIPEAILRTTHDAWGISIGIRMFRVQEVAQKEFVALALLEVGAAWMSDQGTEEEQNFRILRTTLHSTVNLLCMKAGMSIMSAAAVMPPSPVKAVTMSAGLAVTLAGEPLLALAHLDDDLVRLTAFGPGAVTHVYQDIGAVLDEYEMAIGSKMLAERDEASFTQLGSDRAAELKAAATEAKIRHTIRARLKEHQLIGLFEGAYAAAADSYIGLRTLDALAARFARTRGAATIGDPDQPGVQARFLALDAKLDLSGYDATRIAAMDQWTELRKRLTTLEGQLDAASPKWDELFEAMDKVQQILDNARYRIEVPPGGQRPVPMIRPGTPAYSAYTEKLAEFESRMSAVLRRAAVLGGGPGKPVDVTTAAYTGLARDAVDPRAAVARLQSLRTAYDARVAEGVAALPTMSKAETWSDSYRLGQRSEQAFREHPDLFHRLRLTEMALRSSIAQARSAAATTGTDPTVAGLIEREAAAAERAIEERRVSSGLILPSELDAELAGRRATEDRTLAARIDAAYPRARLTGAGAEPAPLAPEEIKALRGSELRDLGGRLSSTEQQLTRAWELLTPMRSVPLANPTLDPEQMSRLERQLMVIDTSPFLTWNAGWIKHTSEYTVPTGYQPVVARVGGDEYGTTKWGLLPMMYGTVIAINADAVALLGPEPVFVALAHMRELRPDELRLTGAGRPIASTNR